MPFRFFRQSKPPGVVILSPDATDPNKYNEVDSFAGGTGGGGSDPASARETTLQLIRSLLAGVLKVDTGDVTGNPVPTSITVGASPVGLNPPAEATEAIVFVLNTGGGIYRSIGGTPGVGTPTILPGGNEEIRGSELNTYQMVKSGTADAKVYVEYRTVT